MVSAESQMKGYSAAQKGAVFHRLTDSGYLRLAGPDRVDFLQRQTSNDVRRLSEHQAVMTVLTSPTAKILDVLWLVAEPDTIGIITLPGRGAATAAFLRSRIFFMDKVTVENATVSVAQIDLEGVGVAESLSKINLQTPKIGEAVTFDLPPAVVRAIGKDGLVGPAVRLLVSTEDIGTVEDTLLGLGITELSAEAFEVLRVEAGQPGEQSELTEEYTPLEVRLERAISDSKGCYTGQEIIARQITYDKVTRSLVGLALSAQVEVGSPVLVEGRRVGEITSAVESPRLGWIGLGVLKRPHIEPGVEAIVQSGQGEVSAVVTALPFA